MMDQAKHDAALQNPRVSVQDLQEGYGALGYEAAPPGGKDGLEKDAEEVEEEEEQKQQPPCFRRARSPANPF